MFDIRDGVLIEYTGSKQDRSQIVIPDGTTAIGTRALCQCDCESVVLPEGLTVIGEGAFQSCRYLKNINIPDSVLEIGNSAFAGCTELESITLPISIETISSQTFLNCSSLSSISLHDGLKQIGPWAFSGCGSLESVVIPDSVTAIGRDHYAGAFEECTALKHVRLPKAITAITDHTFYRCSELEEIIIPDSVSVIGESAFCGCSSLKSVTLPDSVNEIGASAFFGCSSLKSVIFPEGVEVIGYRAFEGCENLSECNIPHSLKKIGDLAFSECPSITKVRFWKTVPEVADSAFGEPRDSLKVYFDSSVFDSKERLSKVWCIYPSDTPVTDEQLASLYYYQNTDAWLSWVREKSVRDPGKVFSLILCYLRQEEKIGKKTVNKLVDYCGYHSGKLPYEMRKELIDILEEKKYAGLKKLKEDPEAVFIFADDEPADSIQKTDEITELLADYYVDEKVKRAVKKGIPYKDNKQLCDPDLLVRVFSESAAEWERNKAVTYGEQGAEIEVLDMVPDVQFSRESDIIVGMLDKDAFNGFLVKMMDSIGYRTYLLAWANYADGNGIKEAVSTFKSMKRGKARERYKAQNIENALMINRSTEAMRFFESIDRLGEYASRFGMTAMEMRDSLMVPTFGLDESGKMILDIGDYMVEVSIGDDLKPVLFDTKHDKVISKLPAKSDDMKKLKAASERIATLKKDVKGFVKERYELLLKMHMSGESLRQEGWRKVYCDNPVIRHLASKVIWMDENNRSFTSANGRIIDARCADLIPEGKIRIAHVLEMTERDIDEWRIYFSTEGRQQLFEQIWEPIVRWNENDIKNRYNGAVLSRVDRNSMKKKLGERGIAVWSDAQEGEFQYREYSYAFSDINYMNFGSSFRIKYQIDEESGNITLLEGQLLQNAREREINAILFEMDLVTLGNSVAKDDYSVLNENLLDSLNLAQVLKLIGIATANGSVSCSAILLEYKKKHFDSSLTWDELFLSL